MPRFPEVKADQFALKMLKEHGIGNFLEYDREEFDVHQRIVWGDYPWDHSRFRSLKSEADCLARLEELAAFDTEYRDPKAKAKTRIREVKERISQ